MTITVGVHEAKTRLSELINMLSEGTEIVITNRGTEVARLAPPRPRGPRSLGMDAGRFTVPEDFNAPDDAVIALFEKSDVDRGIDG